MNCQLCSLDISEDNAAVSTVQCCGRKFHTACMIQHIGTLASHGCHAYCYCGVTLFYNNHSYSSEDEPNSDDTIATLVNNPTSNQEIENLKKTRKEFNKSHLEFMKLVRQKKRIFKEETNPHVMALKQMQRSIKTTMRSEEAYKNYSKYSKKYSRLYKQVKTKYSLQHHTLWQLGLSMYSDRRGIPYIVRKAFRIKL